MKIHKLEILILDFDEVGAEGITRIVEDHEYPNHCFSPSVMRIETVDIGEWSDDHPLNGRATQEAEYARLFRRLPLSEGVSTEIPLDSKG